MNLEMKIRCLSPDFGFSLMVLFFFLVPAPTVGKVACHFTVGVSSIIQIGFSLILRFSVKHLSSASIKY